MTGTLIGLPAALRSERGMQLPLPFGVFLGLTSLVVLFFGQTALHLHQIPLMIRLGPVWPYFAIPGRNYPSVGHLAAVLFVLALIGALLIPARDRRTVGGISRAA